MIVGVSGKIGSGKDTVGYIIQYLTSSYYKSNYKFDYFLDNSKKRNDYPDFLHWQIKKFADKLKECVSIITGIPKEDLEKSEVKNRLLGTKWIRYSKANGFFIKNGERIMNSEPCSKEEYEEELKTNWPTAYRLEHTPRTILQLLGTEVGRFIHPDLWVNALMVDYKTLPTQQTCDEPLYPNWIITDMRFPNELKAVKAREGITIRVNRDPERDCDNCSLGTDCQLMLVECHGTNKGQTIPHISETALDNATFDYIIDNNGTIEELIEKVKEILIKERII